MAVALATTTNAYFKVLDDGQSIRVICNVVVSGSYSTGGEDLSTILADARVKAGTLGKTRFFAAYAQSSNGANVSIPLIVGTTPIKMKFFSSVGTELGAGAYAAGYTGDLIRLDFSFPKYGAAGV
jgi:hypothetical protein